jgi:hypothetical protein
MIRQWSDGPHDDSTREFELKREFEQRSGMGTAAADLKLQNDWLRLQLIEGPWRIENYNTPRNGAQRGTAKAVGPIHLAKLEAPFGAAAGSEHSHEAEPVTDLAFWHRPRSDRSTNTTCSTGLLGIPR